MSALPQCRPEEEEPAAAARAPKATGAWSLWAWLRERPTWMSFAMFFMLICGGLQMSAMGPALPIIEHQCNMFAAAHHRLNSGIWLLMRAGAHEQNNKPVELHLHGALHRLSCWLLFVQRMKPASGTTARDSGGVAGAQWWEARCTTSSTAKA